MSRSTPELPSGYPDPAIAGRLRTAERSIGALHFRMTLAPGERIIELWELRDGDPVQWAGNVFRLDDDPPCLYMNYAFEKALSRAEREAVARAGAELWHG